MQIGEFKDWNIKNINNEKISSKNVTCQEKPPNPRGGNLDIMYNQVLNKTFRWMSNQLVLLHVFK